MAAGPLLAAAALAPFSTEGVSGAPRFRAPPGAGSRTRGGEAPSGHPMMAGEMGSTGGGSDDWHLKSSSSAASSKGGKGGDLPVLDKDDPGSSWEYVKEAARQAAADKHDQQTAEKPAPAIINVPSLCSRCVGRGNDIFQMWQRLHQGRRVIVLRGVDGLGKSSLAAAFGEHAMRSARFTCVQWIDGSAPVAPQLQEFMAGVKGRKELNVMFILDGVAQPESVLGLIPPSDAIAVVITTNNLTAFATKAGVKDANLSEQASFVSRSLYVHDVGPPAMDAAAEIVADAFIGGSSASGIGIGQTPSTDETEIPADQAPAAERRRWDQTRAANPTEQPKPIPTVPSPLAERPGVASFMASTGDGPEKALQELGMYIAGRLGGVPILCHLAGCYMHQVSMSPSDFVALLDEHVPLSSSAAPASHHGEGEDGNGAAEEPPALSVSGTLRSLVDLAIERIGADVGVGGERAAAVLESVALLNTDDLNPGLMQALHGDDGVRIIMAAVAFGLGNSHWSHDAVTLQPMVAVELRRRLAAKGNAAVEAAARHAATSLFGLWPRRWRGMGADRAWSLARHAVGLQRSLLALATSTTSSSSSSPRAESIEIEDLPALPDFPLSLETLACFDRAATFMAHISVRDIAAAGALWHTVVAANERAGLRNSAEAARVALEATRVFYRVGDHRAVHLSKLAHEIACEAHGKRSTEAALALVYRVKFLPLTQASLDLLNAGADVLRAAVGPLATSAAGGRRGTTASAKNAAAAAKDEADDGDVTADLERMHMLREGLFVITLGTMSMMEALKLECPPALWQELEQLNTLLKDSATAKRVEENRMRAKLSAQSKGSSFDLDRP